jgi:SNF2 family DNA or RNA helicase
MVFQPHEYQQFAIDFILQHPVSAVFLDCGLGKTVITLTAIRQLLQAGDVHRVLVVAPLRVAREVWPAEVSKWDHLRDLKIAVAVGSPKERLAAIRENAPVTVVNRENLSWLQSLAVTTHQFDAVVLDELSSFKNIDTRRSKAALRICRGAGRVIGLTGTPAANSLMDLWSEYRILDGGERLGRYLAAFQQRYFLPVFGFNGYITGWRLKEGSEEQIYRAIGDVTVSMRALDHLPMPEKICSNVMVRMSPAEEKMYAQLRDRMLLSLPGGQVSALNGRALAVKLIQMANGLAYAQDGTPLRIHSKKLNALEDLIEEAVGNPVLVVYNFRHDLARIEGLLRLKGISCSVLDSSESIRKWNRGELQVGLINPMSAGHGLNLQEGGAVIIWYGLPWSLEYYTQTNARLWRQGQKKDTVVIRHILTEGTIDEHILQVLEKKDRTQKALIDAVKAELGGK